MYSANKKRKAMSPGWLRFAQQIVDQAGVLDEDTAGTLLQAFAAVPRDRFVPEAFNLRATEDISLPIGYGQTISKPSKG